MFRIIGCLSANSPLKCSLPKPTPFQSLLTAVNPATAATMPHPQLTLQAMSPRARRAPTAPATERRLTRRSHVLLRPRHLRHRLAPRLTPRPRATLPAARPPLLAATAAAATPRLHPHHRRRRLLDTRTPTAATAARRTGAAARAGTGAAWVRPTLIRGAALVALFAFSAAAATWAATSRLSFDQDCWFWIRWLCVCQRWVVP